jgi:DNA-binding MarR family transcriptional regulator
MISSILPPSLRIDTLEKEGLVIRMVNREDRRSVFVALAPKRFSLLEKVIPEALRVPTFPVA